MAGSQRNNNSQSSLYQRIIDENSPQKNTKKFLLGKNTDNVGENCKSQQILYAEARSDRYRFQQAAHSILAIEGRKKFDAGEIDHPLNIHRTAKCLRVRIKKVVCVHKSKEHKKAFYSGLVTCTNVFTCPVCAAKIQEKRRLEIAKLFDAAYKGRLGADKKVVMVTFTFSHSRKDKLFDLMEAQGKALRRLRQSDEWKEMKGRFGFVGFIRSLEVTYGINGWHPHTHEALVVDDDTDVGVLRERLLKAWFRLCSGLGMVGDKVEDFMKRSVQITDNCHCSGYLTKMDSSKHWGTDRELAKSMTKQGKKSGKHPFSFLKDYADGDKKAAALYLEYVFGMQNANGKTRRQIQWSHGLQGKVGVKAKSDEDLVLEQKDSADLLATLNVADWNLILKHKVRSQILDVAENFGAKGIQNFLDDLRRMPEVKQSVFCSKRE